MEESRDKVVNFRVTNHEYVSYCRACSAAGLDNLSEMVRVAMSQFVGQRMSAPANGRNIENPDPPASRPISSMPESGGTADRRSVRAREDGRAGKWLSARSAGKENV